VRAIVKLRSRVHANISQFHARFRRAYKFNGRGKKKEEKKRKTRTRGRWCICAKSRNPLAFDVSLPGRNNRGSNERRGNDVRLRVNLRSTVRIARTFPLFRVTLPIKIALVSPTCMIDSRRSLCGRVT